MRSLSIIFPVHNEAANLPALLEGLRRVLPDLPEDTEIIAVNDGSTDRSAEILEEAKATLPHLRVLNTPGKSGMGGALMAGSLAGEGRCIVWSMADLSDRHEDIPKMVAKLDEGYDLVIASRADEGGNYGDLGRVKASLSHAYSAFARRWFGIPATDITNAYRAMTRELLAAAAPRARDFAVSPELAIRARRLGARITTVPTVYRYRVEGDSKFKMVRMMIRYSLLLFLKFTPRPKAFRSAD
ncbi:MAG: glycosyltransferase family 2 protein [Deltaproteobacteria bacterium]|nr:glycosyltransferase family 2 protein [bacterium]MCB9488006.1 glycosyltransferase family 2 protein [Deltaproteobacteria bacterium]